MYHISSIRHSWPERAGFEMARRQGYPNYTFLHFYGSVDVLIGEEIVTTRPNACIIYPPNMPQYYKASDALLYDWFHFDSERELPAELPQGGLFYPAEPTAITALVRELESEFFTQREFRDTVIDLKVSELTLKLAREHSGSMSTISHRTREDFQALRSQILLHPERRWSVDDMAASVHLGNSHFHSVYTTLFGCSPHTDLIRARIRVACDTLQYSGKSIAEIAEEMGYNNTSHFSRQFRNQIGMSPSVYRKMHAAGDKEA